MKAPEFKLKFSEEAEALSEIILADEQPKRFIRRRAFKPDDTTSIVTDSDVRSYFTDKGRQRVKFGRIFKIMKPDYYNGAVVHFFICPIITALLAAILIYNYMLGNFDGGAGSIAATVILSVFAVLAATDFVIYTARWVYRIKYLDRVYSYLDEVYVLYDTDGNPCCVCVEGENVRILHKQTLRIIKNGKVKTVTDSKQVYLEYLDLFPQSVLDMSAYVSERKNYLLAPEPDSTYKQYIYVVANQTDRQISLSANLNDKSTNYLWKFHKLLIDLDNGFNIQRIYSCAGRRFDYCITLATAKTSGARVYEELKLSLIKQPQAQNILDGINFNGNTK